MMEVPLGKNLLPGAGGRCTLQKCTEQSCMVELLLNMGVLTSAGG